MNYIDEFIHNQAALLHTDKTIQNYKDVLALYSGYCKRTFREPFDIDTVSHWSVYLRGRGLRAASISSYLRHLKAFFHYLGINSVVSADLYKRIRIPKERKKNVVIYSDDEIMQIYDSVSAQPLWIMYRNKLIISLMYDSGLRRNECCCINRSDIKEILLVHGKGEKDRMVPLGMLTQKHLKMYLALCPYSTNYLLCTRTGAQMTNNAIKQLFSKLSKKLPFEFSPHRLRHNFATNYLIDSYEEKGFFDAYSLQVLLGHEDISTTDRYVHLAAQYIATRKRVSHLDKIYNGVPINDTQKAQNK